MAIIDNHSQAQLENMAFISGIDTKGVEKAASALTDFIRVKIRESSFARKILPPKPVTSTDLVQSQETDQPMRLVEMDKVSEAYPITFLEPAQEKYYQGKRFPVYYTKLASEEFYKPTQEIMTYRVPIKTIVQENYLKDLQKAEDKMFINTVNKIIDDRLAGAIPSGVADPTAEYSVAGPFTPDILAEGLKSIVLKEIPMGPILINEVDFLDLLKLKQNAVGSAILENIVVNGYTYTKLLGQTFIRTIKHDVVVPGTIYLFSTPEFLGVFDVLEDVKAFVKQEGSHLRFYLWETVGMAIGNINGVARIKLTK